MRVITQSCVLFLWMHTLTFVKSLDCTLEQFLKGPLYDSNFDTTDLETSYPGGKSVRVGCNVGFSGFFKLLCIDGKWQSRGTVCQPRSCGHPGDAQFADFHLEKGDDFVFGSQVVYTCHKGFQMVSRTNFRRCMAEGWDGVVPVCEAQQCPVILVKDNVLVYGDLEEATYGNVVRFSCKSSTEVLVGSSELYCDENGDWSGTVPKCQEITCTVPHIKNGHVPGDIQEYKEHDILQYECDHGYTSAEERSSKCTKLGQRAEWSPTPACEPIKCKLTLQTLEGTSYEPAYRNLFSPGETLTVTCGQKYWISNPHDITAVTTCKEDGKWTITPVCQEVRCSNRRPDHVYNWNIYWGQIITLDQTTNYWCRAGYKRTSTTGWAKCTRDGWKPDPLCEEIKCNRPDIPNANIISSGIKQTYKDREKIRYQCKEGYRGVFTLTCGEHGWAGNAQCTAITCNRHEYQNSDIAGEYQHEYKYNDQVEYICKDGYEGSFNMTCKDSGWIGTPDCTRRQCRKLHIENAYITRNEKNIYGFNERVHYACTHDADKVFALTCGRNVWTGIQTCPACPNPEIQHGFAVGPYNDTLYYTCDEGFKLLNKGWWAEAKCHDGVWSGIDQCIENTKCGNTPVIPNGEVKPPRVEGNSYRITCNLGYSAQISTFNCHQGKWNLRGYSPETVCKFDSKLCNSPPKVGNAVIMTPYKKEYLPNSAVTYQCRDKYTIMDGEDTIQCIDGKWEERNIKCTSYCDKLKDDTMTITADKERYMDGEVITYKCAYSDVEHTAKCVNSNWNKSAECKVKPCELPDDTPNGYYQIIRGEEFVFGTTIKYFCYEGYQMVSKDDTRTCMLDKWTNHVPVCEPLSCEPPPADGGVTVTGLSENDDPILPNRFLKFSCDGPGKYLNGSSLLICGKDGQWDNPFPSCEDITCDADMMPPNLNVVGLPAANETMKIGHKLRFSCDNQYTMDGSEEVECLETGKWNTAFPTCAEKCKVAGVSDSVYLITRVPGNQVRKGQKLRFQCRRRGDFLRGKAEVECSAGGQWSDPFPTCGAPLGCGKPPPLENGDIKTTVQWEYRHNDWVEYVCQPYYTIESQTYKICKNGEWIGQMRCLKPCTVDREAMNAHNIEFRYKRDDKLYSSHNDMIEFRCKGRRRHIGTVDMRQSCVDGEMQLPTCHLPLCRDSNTQRNSQKTFVRKRICQRTMRVSIFLLFLQLWTNVEVSSSQSACLKLPDVLHAHVSDPDQQYQEGDLIQFTCKPGYTASGPGIKYICMSNGWLLVRQGTCDFSGVSCTPPTADAGVTVKGLPENDDPILPDHPLTFSCDDPGKYLNGSSVLMCGQDGQWDNPFPFCEDITCEADVMPPYLNVVGLPAGNEAMKIGHKLQFSCNDQYTMDGSEEVECLQTGKWNASFPTCTEKCKVAGVLDSVYLITRVPGNQVEKGQKLRFQCRRRGDLLRGKAEVECSAGGQWSDPFPTCGAPLGCGRPPPLADGDTKTTVYFSYRHNERVEFICQNFFTMEGQPYKTCINGEWIGQMRCLKPCAVDREVMNAHNIEFRYTHSDKLYVVHNDVITFRCKGQRRHIGTLSMRQRCVDGVVSLPTCQ
ncbi:complement factor H-like [Plectropomus leopardus]|uniref:complement factor H-like n=1 Tax=Plectropomus leopardus TaxID=160734 RepID=UPI001C4C1D7B|nr:complement factor H-like [Plectropomus leopardus]